MEREKLRQKPWCLFNTISEETSHYFDCILLVTQTSSGTMYKDGTGRRQGSLKAIFNSITAHPHPFPRATKISFHYSSGSGSEPRIPSSKSSLGAD